MPVKPCIKDLFDVGMELQLEDKGQFWMSML